MTKLAYLAIIEVLSNHSNMDPQMSDKNPSSYPTNNKSYDLSETNQMVPHLEKSFLRLKLLNQSVKTILNDLGLEMHELDAMDTLPEDIITEETYSKLTDLKLYLSSIQKTVRHLSSFGCLIDNLDKGIVVWPNESGNEITWKYGDKQCHMAQETTETMPLFHTKNTDSVLFSED